ncbi:MAG: leucine-rich repeat domain-containing protein [Promethearchaeota archaeon]
MKSYFGIALKEHNFNVISQLEQIIGKPIRHVDYKYPKRYACEIGFDAQDGDIIYLSIVSNKFNEFPREVLKLTKLEVLLWSKSVQLKNKNNISIPEEISKLNKLKTLSLHHNSLISLPDSLFNLKYLENLNLESNELNTIPAVIGNLKSLKYLFLGDNRIRYFPYTFWELKNLEYLDLDGNKIEIIPDEIENLKSIKTLYLGMNVDTKLPLTLKNLDKLELLNINFDPDNPDYYPKDVMKMLDDLEKRGVIIEK